jgi:hypothetical protein
MNIVGYKTEAETFTGLNVSPGWLDVNNLKGVSIAAYNKVYDRQNGLTIGLFNVAENLNGAQIGLINIAKNNSVWTKVLPLINMHFD